MSVSHFSSLFAILHKRRVGLLGGMKDCSWIIVGVVNIASFCIDNIVNIHNEI